ncbi:YopX family protein [Lactiplantibacillus plantarum]
MIKFRGIPLEDVSDIDGVDFDGTFVCGNYVKYGDGALIVGDVLEANGEAFWPSWWASVVPKTVEQFTGLKDVNGKDIYVGDILKTKAGLIQIVDQGILAIDREDIISGFYANNLSDGKPHTFSYDDEVIGNVHENPELLKG